LHEVLIGTAFIYGLAVSLREIVVKRNIGMAFSKLGGVFVKGAGFVSVLLLAGCLGSGNGTRVTAQDIVDDLPADIIPIVIENEDEIRDLIDSELDEDLRDDANDIIDFIIDIATTTLTVSSVTTVAGTN
jgi:hypothetical protein